MMARAKAIPKAGVILRAGLGLIAQEKGLKKLLLLIIALKRAPANLLSAKLTGKRRFYPRCNVIIMKLKGYGPHVIQTRDLVR